MKVQIGDVQLDKVTNQHIIHPNKTRMYLLPCLMEYGDLFMNKINNVFKVAVGLGDMVISKRYYKAPERHLFILLDTTIARAYFVDFINWIRDQPMYEDDYVFGDFNKSPYHMLIIRFPPKYYDSFETFKEGKYSQMFNQETIKTFFKSKDNSVASRVLIKDHNYKVVFTRRLNKLFNTNLTTEDYDGELDLPPKESEETFNHHLK